MKRRWLYWIGGAAMAVLVYRSVLFVDEAEFCIVTQFGRVVERLDASGFHLKMPYQSVIRISKRLHVYDPRPSEFLAKEKKNVNLDVFVCWRVDDPRRFLETVNDRAGAESRIHDIVWSELSAEIGRNTLETLVSTDPTLHDLVALVGRVTQRCKNRAEAAFGIEIADMQLKRISQPAQVRESVFLRMRKERARIASQYRAEGEEQAMKIRADADKERTVTLAKAYAEAEKKRGDAEAEATRIYLEAHRKDPKLYELLRTLEAYRKMLDEKTTILLSSDSDLLKFLLRGPGQTESTGGE